jgi:hypothetical protein
MVGMNCAQINIKQSHIERRNALACPAKVNCDVDGLARRIKNQSSKTARPAP